MPVETERVIAPERLDFVDVVTSSHNPTDHLDRETLIPLLQANPDLTVLVSRANVDFAANRLQVPPERPTPIPVDEQPIKLHHSHFKRSHPGMKRSNRTRTDHKYIGLIIQLGERIIYHSGDAVPYDGLFETLRRRKIDFAILPINGRDPARRDWELYR